MRKGLARGTARNALVFQVAEPCLHLIVELIEVGSDLRLPILQRVLQPYGKSGGGKFKASYTDGDEMKQVAYKYMAYREKQTARHLRVRDVICIITHMSPLKTNVHVSRFELSN